MVTGELAFTVGHISQLVQGQALVFHLLRQDHQVVKGIALDVELSVGPVLQQTAQFKDIVAPYVSFVRSGMHRDALRPGFQTQLRRARDRGDAQVARVAQGGDLVEVDRQGGGHLGER
jgi:hypothetical protein